jgi:phosphatidylglycerol:prolipoprotein diacylglycerol transferase
LLQHSNSTTCHRAILSLSFNVHPIAFHIGSFEVHWYGVLVMLGFVAGLWTASRRGVRDGLAPETIQDLGAWLIVGTIVGARTLYVISYWHERFAAEPWTEIFAVWRGGLVFYGGLIGASLATIIFALKRKLPLWKLGDALAPSISLGYFFGRLGCLMNGCCYGRPTDLPWAIHFPVGHETYPNGVHPTELYESFLGLGLYAALAWLYRRKTFDGQIFAIYLMCYAVLRAFVESFRGDYPIHYLGGWATPAQLVSFGIFTAGLLLYWQLPRARKQAAATA